MNPLVSVSWLAERINDSNMDSNVDSLVVLDATLPPVGVTPAVDTHARYVERHIPGAVFFDIDALSDHATSLPHMLQSDEEFSRNISALGIGDGMTIVVYEQEGVFSAPRARWMMKAYGAKQVYLLDGGLKAWAEAGQPLQSGEVSRPQATFTAKLDRAQVKDFDQMQTMISARESHGPNGSQILDARSAGRFSGAAPEPRAGLSSGHMPGAISTPFLELVEEGRMKPAAQLRGVFAAKGVKLDQPMTTSCGSGVTAAVVALGLELAGADKVTLYDGSWAEYASRPEAVIEKDV
ncbi:MAG: 3-mercaptopyruvate sulfurtransferase [Edaphobacter sp.]|uniref:3-mercaptopyruvate sulfurtransferase n=1 Tax=Edaphobacter sp. TaxID=1934404 RepID=UPI00238DF0B8|nr:3-mercaptopyruvate sulfurtransferase [Edaphobacter sp.]MDE1176928.1 3-mercaptopyruvate sulfurtransferase [Edaphobacter sp.]